MILYHLTVKFVKLVDSSKVLNDDRAKHTTRKKNNNKIYFNNFICFSNKVLITNVEFLQHSTSRMQPSFTAYIIETNDKYTIYVLIRMNRNCQRQTKASQKSLSRQQDK